MKCVDQKFKEEAVVANGENEVEDELNEDDIEHFYHYWPSLQVLQEQSR